MLWKRALELALPLLLATLSLLAASFASAAEPGPPRVTAIEVTAEADRTRVTVDVTGAVGFNVYVLPDPYRTIIDLPEIEFQLDSQAGSGAGSISGFRFGSLDRGRSRIVLDTTRPVLIEKSLALHASEGKPARLVVELVPTDAETFVKVNRSELALNETIPAEPEMPPLKESAVGVEVRETTEGGTKTKTVVPLPQPKPDRAGQAVKTILADPAKLPPGKKVVVIDPGHGGIDPGAIGLKGTAEKDVVLAFARSLKVALEATGRYRVVLTRERDVFLSLRERVHVARSNQAMLFVALHADSLRRSDTRGATVYTLSETGSDAEAEALAQKENRADIIGGVDFAAENEEVTGILIDLAQRETKNHSTFFARELARQLKPVTRMTSRPIRSAGFRVLKAPDVPSILLELGYLSSKADEALLNSASWRGKVAKSVTDAIEQYFATQLAAR